MTRRRHGNRWLVLPALLLAACDMTGVSMEGGGYYLSGPDGGADASPDGGADASPDGGADASPDGGADGGPQDGGADGGTDSGITDAAPPDGPSCEISVDTSGMSVTKTVLTESGVGTHQLGVCAENGTCPLLLDSNWYEAEHNALDLNGAEMSIDLSASGFGGALTYPGHSLNVNGSTRVSITDIEVTKPENKEVTVTVYLPIRADTSSSITVGGLASGTSTGSANIGPLSDSATSQASSSQEPGELECSIESVCSKVACGSDSDNPNSATAVLKQEITLGVDGDSGECITHTVSATFDVSGSAEVEVDTSSYGIYGFSGESAASTTIEEPRVEVAESTN